MADTLRERLAPEFMAAMGMTVSIGNIGGDAREVIEAGLDRLVDFVRAERRRFADKADDEPIPVEDA